MPSPGSRRRTQCTFKDGRDRCRRDGEGKPALCAPHRMYVESEARRAERDAQPGGAIRSAIEDFFNGKPITREKVAQAINEAAYGLGGIFGAGAEMFNEADPYDTQTGRFQHEVDNEKRPPQDRVYGIADELAEKRNAIRAAKVALGFAADEPVTVAQVKLRQRELARRHHPDRPGGSLEKMQRINSAVDVLEHAL